MKHSMLDLVSGRTNESKQLWIVGCSYAHGIGVSNKQRYGTLIGDALNISTAFLTKGGTSVDWAADQILRSDIRPDDIVVWGLTGSSRFTYADQLYRLHNVRLDNFDQVPDLSSFINKKFLVSNYMVYNTIKSIEQVKNYLDKLTCKFVLAVFPTNIAEHDIQILDFTSKLKNAIILFDPDNYSFIDYGTDLLHPGPLHHKFYADRILNHIGKL
jgi:hypothetical protein